MATGKRRTLKLLSELAWREVDDWVENFGSGMSPPVPLDQLALSKGIQCVKALPLLSTAGLVREADHYEIFVNSEARGFSLKNGSIYSADDGSWAEFPPPLRFTIAHEIAHVFFYDAAGGDHKASVFESHAAGVEWECNRIARVLLLPIQHLRDEIAKNYFDIQYVASLVERYRVSPEVFMRRLHLYESSTLFDGAEGVLAYLTEVDGEMRVKACQIWGPLAWARFGVINGTSGKSRRNPTSLENLSIEQLRIHSHLTKWLREGKPRRERIPVAYSKSKTLQCNLAVDKIRHSPPGWLLALQVVAED